MSGYQGDIRLGDTIHCKFVTTTSAGVPTQLAGSPVISAYPAASTTQLTAGITLTVDFDSVTGLNHVTVVATSGNGYLTATNYTLVITTGTVGGVSVVGYVVGSFSIEDRSAIMPITAARTLLVDTSGRVDVGSTMGVAEVARIVGTASGGTSTSIKFPASTVTTAQCPVGGTVRIVSGSGAFQWMPVASVTSGSGYVTEAFGPTGWTWPVANASNSSGYQIEPGPGYIVASSSDMWSDVTNPTRVVTGANLTKIAGNILYETGNSPDGSGVYTT